MSSVIAAPSGPLFLVALSTSDDQAVLSDAYAVQDTGIPAEAACGGIFGRRYWGAAYYGPRYFGSGCPVDATEADTSSGGWRRKASAPFRDETDYDREARIKAERVRMGILPPDITHSDIDRDTTGDVKADPGLLKTPSNFTQPYSLAAHLLPEDLAGLEALAARAAELSIDEEIEAWLGLQRLEEQRRLYERDEDDAAVLLLAIATIH